MTEFLMALFDRQPILRLAVAPALAIPPIGGRSFSLALPGVLKGSGAFHALRAAAML